MAESDLLITKATIILDKPEHWTQWLFLQRDSADRNELWKYVDPDLSEELVARLDAEKPLERQYRDFHRPAQAAAGADVDIMDLTDQELARYEAWYRTYSRSEARWLQKEKALREFTQEISRTIAARHIHLIADCTSAHNHLRTLKKHLCPSKAKRRAQLQARYQALKTQPRKENLDTWFEDWLETTHVMGQANLPEVQGNRAQQDFILAVKSLDNSWSANKLSQLIQAEAEDKPYTSISDLVAQYTSYYRRTRPIASGLGTFATLSITPHLSAPSASSLLPSQSPPSQGRQPRRVIECLCGDSHKFEKCPYVNQAIRPSGWQPAQGIEQEFQKLRSSGTPKALVLQSVEKRLASASTSDKYGYKPAKDYY